MEWMSFKTGQGKASYGIRKRDRVVDIGAIRPGLPTLKDFLASEEFRAASAIEGPEHALSEVSFLPVIPNPGKIVCIGRNYREHIAEGGQAAPEYPVMFLRLPSSQVGHREALVKPRVSDRFDYEGELAVIIGKGGRHISEKDALRHVVGFACYNEGSIRDWQRHTQQATPGKNFDASGSFGPWMTTEDILKDRSSIRVTTRVNGKRVQNAHLGQMIFSIEQQIAYVSTFTALEVGDVFVTGTPGGVGDFMTPPKYLVAGDRVEIEITGIGILENTVVDEK
jgi:2-keto-4-pentenoate hydratase/2-oxohepta-3-ene-1,7-dioic acid hydratase in catechol pathway